MKSALFGIVLSLVSYIMFYKLQERTKISILNPLLLSSIFIIIFLAVFKIDYEVYQEGGKIISLLIGPATVSLAIPLYNNLEIIKSNFKVISIGVISGIIVHALAILIVIILLKLDKDIGVSLIPKSITTAIAIDVSKNLKGIVEVTVATVVITGIVGATLSPLLNKIFNIKSDEAIGLALGSSAHAVGTAKAAGENPTQGSFSSISLILTGLLTVFIAPLLAYIYLLII